MGLTRRTGSDRANHHRHVGALLSALGGCYSPNAPIMSETSGTTGSVLTTGGDSEGSTSGAGPVTTGDVSSSSGSTSTSATGSQGSSTGDEAAGAECGDGIVGGDEVCDDGLNDGSYGSCTADCAELGPHCGDAAMNGPEVCDDGDAENGDGCNVDCVASGTVMWTRSYAGAAGFEDACLGVDVDSDDSIVAGGHVGLTASDDDVLLLRYDAAGSLLWDLVHDLGDDSQARDVAIGPDGQIAITGGLSEQRVLTAVFDDAGSLDWSEALVGLGGGDVGGAGVEFDEDGDVYTVAGVYVGSYDIAVRRYTANGGLVWAQVYDGGLIDSGFGIALADQAVFVAGRTQVSASDTNGWLRRHDLLQGNSEWTREYAGADMTQDQASGVAFDPAGFIVVVGFSVPDVGVPSSWIRKYDLDGAQQWTEEYEPGALGNAAFGVAVDDGGQIAVTGVISFDPLEPFVAKHEPGGAQLWIDMPQEGATLPGFVPGVAVDSSGNVVVCGTQDDDVWLQKYAP